MGIDFGDARLPQRFWDKAKPDSATGCWLWTAAKNSPGYGQIYWEGRQVGAHRLAYEVLVGPITPGFHTDHLCRVHSCVNPAHLEAVTERENILRGEGTSARHARQTHCKYGHEFTEKNTLRLYGGRTRSCRTCNRRRSRESKERRASHE